MTIEEEGMNIEKMMERIDQTDYWDMRTLDFQTDYLGETFTMWIEDVDDDHCWKVEFLNCRKLQYTTDADWRGEYALRECSRSGVGGFGQNIEVYESEQPDFYRVEMDLCNLFVELHCKEIRVERVPVSSHHFFWEENTK